MSYFGRKKLYTDFSEITRDNVAQVLDNVKADHSHNENQIEYLYNYYKGNTPILQKEKEVREKINHKIAVNRAHEIVSFKLGYGFGEPILYIRRGQEKNLTDDITRLNEHMFDADKNAADRELAEWMYICGTAYRMVLPSREVEAEEPFHIFTLDPRHAFVVYHSGVWGDPVMGVKYITRVDGDVVYSVYTKDRYFELIDGQVVEEKPNPLGMIPIIEYPANTARLGAFEIVLPLLDAINEVESNRLDDLVQYVNSFLALLGGSINEDTYNELEKYKMLCLPEGVDAKYLSTPMSQSDIQNLADSLYEYVLTICGLPNRNGGSSTSDTGVSVIYRDGWQTAETQMQAVELMFKKSERRFLRIVLRILADSVNSNVKLRSRDIEIKFSRRNYEGILAKSQVLISMLSCDKIHPELAFTHAGLFLDPESAYTMSKSWWEERERVARSQMQLSQTAGQDRGESGNQVSEVRKD